MSPAEYFELIGLAEESAAAHSMNAVYIYFAYIVATYLVGSDLSRFQCLALTAIYSIFLTLPVFSSLTQISLVTVHIQQFQAAYPDLVDAYFARRTIAPPAYFYNVGVGIWVSAWSSLNYYNQDCYNQD